jgi:hypothetical protein
MYRFIPFIILLIPVFFTGCDKRTAILSEQCIKCHSSSTPEYAVLGARAQYEVSGHKTLGNAYYSNGMGCQICHTNEGFIEFVTYGPPEQGAFVQWPSQPGCFTCHQPHETGDFSLRVSKPVTLDNNTTFDRGSGNLCANCHKIRGAATDTVKETPAKNVMSHWGGHHGPQADIFMGTNAYEFQGKKYSSGMHSSKVEDGCVSCHMALPEGRYGMEAGIGGHSFNIAGEVHHSPTLNNAGCLECHSEMNQVRGTEYFDATVKDFDTDGELEPLQKEVEGLLDRFVNTGGTGILQKMDLPFYKPDGSWNQVRDGTPRSVTEMAVLYNYKLILEDRSKGIHNIPYTVQVLYDSLEAMDPSFDVSLRPN